MDPIGTAPVYEAEPFGSIPDVSRSHSWKTMRKIPLTRGQDTSFSVDNVNMYPNECWVPFAVITIPITLSRPLRQCWILTSRTSLRRSR